MPVALIATLMPNFDRPGLTPTQWLICIIAALGFAFDIYELLMLPLIIKPAIASLSADAAAWPFADTS